MTSPQIEEKSTVAKLATQFGVGRATIERDGQFARARSQPGISVAMALGKVGRPKKGEEKKGSDTTISIGRGKEYLTARLDRDHPQVFLISLFKPTN